MQSHEHETVSDSAKPAVLVTGGAGYVGSHTCLALSEAGFQPVTYDNLSNGHEEFVRWGPLERGDVLDERRLSEVIERHAPVAIVHFAGLIEVGQSVRDPLSHHQTNVGGTVSLLQAARAAGIEAVVFSSTCATYGDPVRLPLDETHPQSPVSPYGRSKLMSEWVLRDCEMAHGIRFVALRYFNAAGADPEGRIGEWHEPETHAIPLAIDAVMGRRPEFTVFGTDYDTRDGTGVRDYVHVLDLADAHVRAVRYLLDGGTGTAINLGTGTGTTVRELIGAVSAAAGRPVPASDAPRRAGDASVLVADNARARDVLGWAPQRDLAEIVGSAWRWHTRHNQA